MVDIASTNARRQVHGSWGAGKHAGRLTKHGIDMDGGDEAAEAVAEEVAAHSTRVSLSTETQRQLTEHKAPRHRAALQAGLEFLQRQYHRRCRNTAPDSSSGSTERWRVP